MKRILVIASLLFTTPAFADDWSDWRDNFTTVITACTAAREQACLPRAFNSRAIPAPEGAGVADLLARDLRVATVLLHQADARTALQSQYGIYGNDYLGTGYSVPVGAPYEAARQREYFVPNLGAQTVDATVCPERAPRVWTWRMTSAQFTRALDRRIAAVLRARPDHDRRDIARRLARRGDGHLLIRFGAVPNPFYKGRFGRDDALQIFFADYDQVRGSTFRQAMTATGAATLLANPDPGKSYFIWLYAPDGDTVPASWRALFTLLGQAEH